MLGTIICGFIVLDKGGRKKEKNTDFTVLKKARLLEYLTVEFEIFVKI